MPPIPTADADGESPIGGRHIAAVGKLGGLTRREFSKLLRQHGAIPVEPHADKVEMVVVGADELPLADEELLSDDLCDAAAAGRVEVISETQFWNRLGLVENQSHVRKLYTPAMLAEILNVPVAIVRRWHRRGLIVPAREVHRLPYFEFQEIATARRLAELLDAGASPADIEQKLEQLSRLVPDVERPLAQLSVIVEGRQLLLREGEGLIEPDGQRRLDFGSSAGVPAPRANAESADPILLPVREILAGAAPVLTPEQMASMAADWEDEGRYREAIEMYRVALVAGGPRAELCFRLAELLYLTGETSAARERYSMAIELDEDYVEARANLGCVLAETGELELAVAAFRGALKSHPDYPDAHYHLARLLDDLQRPAEAEEHWVAFLELATDSPWAEEARRRLSWDLES